MDAGAWAYREWGKLSHHFPSFFLLGHMEQIPKDTGIASTEDQAASQASIAMFSPLPLRRQINVDLVQNSEYN